MHNRQPQRFLQPLVFKDPKNLAEGNKSNLLPSATYQSHLGAPTRPPTTCQTIGLQLPAGHTKKTYGKRLCHVRQQTSTVVAIVRPECALQTRLMKPTDIMSAMIVTTQATFQLQCTGVWTGSTSATRHCAASSSSSNGCTKCQRQQQLLRPTQTSPFDKPAWPTTERTTSMACQPAVSGHSKNRCAQCVRVPRTSASGLNLLLLLLHRACDRSVRYGQGCDAAVGVLCLLPNRYKVMLSCMD